MKHEPLFELWEDDAKLFEQMKEQYQSEEERIFFETMRYKEQDEPAYSNEDLILEDENEDLVIEYGVRGVPTTVVLDENNNVLTKFSGNVSKNVLEGNIDEVL